MSASGVLERGAPARECPELTRLAVAWQHPVSRAIQPVGLLEHVGGIYVFRYVANAASVPDFRPLLGFDELPRRYESEWLFPLFDQRIMDVRRPDRSRFLTMLDLHDAATPFEILAITNGRRVGDTIQLFPEPSVGDDGETTCRFLAHGVRHVVEADPDAATRLLRVRVGDGLRLIDEPTNPVNSRAVLTCDGQDGALGYVPDMLLDYVRTVRANAPTSVHVARVNPAGVPPHLRLLVDFAGTAPAGYRPFAGPAWRPLA